MALLFPLPFGSTFFLCFRDLLLKFALGFSLPYFGFASGIDIFVVGCFRLAVHTSFMDLFVSDFSSF